LTPQLSRDQLDAVAAAYAAWCHETRRAHAVTVSGFEDEGAIWIPASPAQAPGVIGTEIPEG
jgi:predicted RNase H-like nuclease